MRTLPSIDTESKVLKQVQVREILATAIAEGLFPPGSRMPDPRRIAVEVNTGLATVRRAIVFLVKQGWLERDAFGHAIVKRLVRNQARSTLQLLAGSSPGSAREMEPGSAATGGLPPEHRPEGLARQCMGREAARGTWVLGCVVDA